jgi:hypothetical protein
MNRHDNKDQAFMKSVEEVYEKMHQQQSSDAANYQMHKKNQLELFASLRAEAAVRQHSGESIDTKLKKIRDAGNTGLLEERLRHNRQATQLEKTAGDMAAEVFAAVEESKKMGAEAVVGTRSICDELCHLYEDIDSERKFRVAKSEDLAQVVRAKLSEVREAVSAERRIRLESQSTLLELFGQMGQKMHLDMRNAKRERQQATDRIISVMEKALPKLDEASMASANIDKAGLEDTDVGHGAVQLCTAMQHNAMRRSVTLRGSLCFSGGQSAALTA